MKRILVVALLLSSIISISNSQEVKNTPTQTEQKILNLSKNKWKLMAERNIDSLDALFHEKAVFVHMSRTMNKEQELEVIRTGGIEYKHADIEETSVRFVENTAIVLDKIRLTAIVRGNEVVNPFMVTEIYVQERGIWKLVSLSFTRLVGQ